MTHIEKPASRVSRAGLSVVHVSGGTGTNLEQTPSNLNSPPAPQSCTWEASRLFEKASAFRARDGLQTRGAERFIALALASTFAFAARDTALMGGVK